MVPVPPSPSSLTSEQWEFVNETALWIHKQTDTSTLQAGTVQRLRVGIPHAASFFDLCCQRDGRLLFFEPVSSTISEEDLSAYYQRYEISDYTAWMFTAEESVIYRDSDMINDRARNQSLIYREWMQPLGLYYSIGSTIVNEGTIFGSITLFQALGQPDFTDVELAILEQVNRHLAAHFSLLRPNGVYPDGFNENLALLAQDAGLSERERDVLRLVAQGQTNREIGRALFISESTVKKHVNALFKKMAVANRLQLMSLAYGGVG